MEFKNIDIYLIAGQSNAVGCTFVNTLSESIQGEKFENVYLYQEGNFSVEHYGEIIKGVTLGMGNSSSQMGIEYGISKVLNEKKNEEFGIIRYALGGSNLMWDWCPRTKWGNIPPKFIGHIGYSYKYWSETVCNGLKKFIEQGYNPNIKALVWMQGESDADKDERVANSYLQNLIDLFACMRVELRLPELKILVGEIATNAPQCPYSDIVRKAQADYCKIDENAILISTKDIPIGRDGLHFDGDSDLKLGVKFGEALSKL